MKLKDEILGLVQQKMDEQLQLFQSADRTLVDPEDVHQLVRALPLLQDAKTEISDIQRKVGILLDRQPQDGDDPYDDHYVLPDNPDSGTNDSGDNGEGGEGRPGWLDELDDLWEDLKGWSAKWREWRRKKKTQNTPEDKSLMEQIKDLLPAIAALHYLYSNTIDKWIREMSGNGDAAAMGKQTREILAYTQMRTEAILDAIASCCVNMSNEMSELTRKLEQCCESMQEAMGDVTGDLTIIKQLLAILDPGRQATQSLSIEARARAIQAAIDVLRGLL